MVDFKELFKNLDVEKQKANPRPCPKCGERDCGGPCYGYECSGPDGYDYDCSSEITQECDDCFYIWCDECKLALVDEIMPNHIHISKEDLFRLIDKASAKWDCTATRSAMRELMTEIELMIEHTKKSR